ncbi:Hsp70 family protein [Nocardia speluncae]|uniref:Hsp70 family protein n=1 Tax=Nocardia speluncae TaxID=419477 RepID=A0A846XPZ8_9NOCA|nr:Hsp70 family protein [Nocardia speluncae]NKY37607.1 Hsp70 family protein [Nocardia speluncae]
MSSVLGVSVGAGAIRLARPPSGTAPGTIPGSAVPESFELRTFVVPPETPSAERAALSVAAALNSNPAITSTVLACRDEQQARALHTAMTEHALSDYELVPDIDAVVEFAAASGALKDVSSLAVFDLGASGLSVTVVDVSTRQVRHTERTGDISGEYFDSLIREQQINSGRIAHPPDPSGLAELDALCRSAKERLSAGNAVALPSSYGPVLLTQENFTALISRAVETAARSAREVVERSGRPVQAVLAVGGGMRIPLVSRALRDAVDMPVLVPPEPESATARGAALLAGKARSPRAPEPAAASDIAPDSEVREAAAEGAPRSGAVPGHPDDSGAYPLQSDAEPGTAAPISGTDPALPGSSTTPPGADPAPPGSGTALPGVTTAQSGPAASPTRQASAPTGLQPSPGSATTVATHSDSRPSSADRPPAPGSQYSRPDLPIPQEGIFGPPTGPPSTYPSAGSTGSRWGDEPNNDHPAPASVLPRPTGAAAPRLSPDEDPPTVALRLPAKLLPRRSFGEPPQRPTREISAAMVAVSALVVVASIGIGLGYGQQMFSQDSATVQGTSQRQTTSAVTPPATSAPPTVSTTGAEHAPLAEPPPVYQSETEAPTTTAGPNTFQVPGLPPIVVPTIPPEALPFPRPTPAER